VLKEPPLAAGKKPLDWADILTRTIVPGLLIALAGYVSERTLTSIASKQENARLVTELQIKREQAESDLRKDIFDQTIQALIGKVQSPRNPLGLSDRLLKLELLSLNFGDSLSLSPLFVEFERDLGGVEQIEGDADHDLRVAHLRRRLRSLARRVASAQLSALEQHGKTKSIKLWLTSSMRDYKWPLDRVLDLAKSQTGISLENLALVKDDLDRRSSEGQGPRKEWTTYQGDPCDERAPDGGDWQAYECDCRLLEEMKSDLGRIDLLDVQRDLAVTFSDMDENDQTVRVDLEVCPHRKTFAEHCLTRDVVSQASESPSEACVTRNFRLDFFNFPKIDNTRLSDNQRFALILEGFSERDSDDGSDFETEAAFLVEVAVVLFPAEYASLKDRPSMNEALEMLERALRVNEDHERGAR
jgi:hypothetical protein